MFDKVRDRSPPPEPSTPGGRIGPEDERIALRCTLKELQLVDSFVAGGEFRSRSELMRAALREFLRTRAMSAVTPSGEPTGTIAVPVRLRTDEVETLVAYATLVGNDRPLGDLLAELVRHGEMERKVSELVNRQRLSVQQATEAKARVAALEQAGRRLGDRGLIGR